MLVPSDKICIDSTGIIVVVLTAVFAIASTYVLAVFWSGLITFNSTMLLSAGDVTVRYSEISSDVPAILWAASITTLLEKIIIKSLLRPPSFALIDASLSLPGTT